MLFHSAEFLFAFLPVVWLGYFLLRRHAPLRFALGWLVLASLGFYGWNNPQFLLVFIASLGFNYLVVQQLLREQRKARRELLVWLGVVSNIGLIFYFKYAGFVIASLNAATGSHWPVLDLALPLAISFFSFEMIALVVDAYRRKLQQLRLLDLFLFVSFFPQLIAGPIVHHSDLVPQFRKRQHLRLSRTRIAVGLALISIGLVKKLGLADVLSGLFDSCNRTFALHGLGLLDSWVCMSAAAFEIYFDYSGYADMAMGLALWFGIRLPYNFVSPYKATSLADFWRRWNLTLMRFLRNYIYIPLGGSRHGRPRQMAASFTTMVICGIWHGAGWHFIAWGALVGSLLVLEMWLGSGQPPLSQPGRLWGRCRVFAAYVLPLVFFLYPEMQEGWQMMQSLLGFNGWSQFGQLRFKSWELPVLGLAFLLVYGSPNTYQLFGRFRPGVSEGVIAARDMAPGLWRWRPNTLWMWAVALMLAFALLSLHQPAEFFYFQF